MTGGAARTLFSSSPTHSTSREPEALIRLIDLEGDRQIRVFETAHPSGPEHPGPSAPLCFHPKAYVFERRDGTGVAFVGSSNLILFR